MCKWLLILYLIYYIMLNICMFFFFLPNYEVFRDKSCKSLKRFVIFKRLKITALLHAQKYISSLILYTSFIRRWSFSVLCDHREYFASVSLAHPYRHILYGFGIYNKYAIRFVCVWVYHYTSMRTGQIKCF